MKTDFAADRLDVPAFALAAATLEGRDALPTFPRLMEEIADEQSSNTVDWTAIGEEIRQVGRPAQNWLHLKVHAVLPLTCQRCLGPVELPLEIERSFRFVESEEAAVAEDDAVEEDLLVTQRDFKLRELIEDELLMALPPVPQHDTCPVEVPMSVQDPDFEEAGAEKPNPFAALATLKLAKDGQG
ncbi:YceD family protein [Xylophilus ampelinus]|uniref:Large ribosomal RNA subunit accumulation protein YceD n=1 Tax=Xylophilus ampelinus TaxID=54067 RepID=A0A318T100_9BURK|nr:YceD family protein [Xylophilus ampelinus]MCS4509464.1 YceD family protein [Xylophilus ampelinus]PYE79193.1 uncharacterized protein DFQ15_103181 [Xylophilus ampelinus]